MEARAAPRHPKYVRSGGANYQRFGARRLLGILAAKPSASAGFEVRCCSTPHPAHLSRIVFVLQLDILLGKTLCMDGYGRMWAARQDRLVRL